MMYCWQPMTWDDGLVMVSSCDHWQLLWYLLMSSVKAVIDCCYHYDAANDEDCESDVLLHDHDVDDDGGDDFHDGLLDDVAVVDSMLNIGGNVVAAAVDDNYCFVAVAGDCNCCLYFVDAAADSVVAALANYFD